MPHRRPMPWMAALAAFAMTTASVACRQRPHRHFDKRVPYREFAAFAGNYEVVSRKGTPNKCEDALEDLPATVSKFSRLSVKNALGRDSLFFFDCSDPNTCDVPEVPLFVPFVREGTMDAMTGELERQAVFSKSRGQCYLARKQVNLKRVDGGAEYEIVESEGLFPIPEDECTVTKASEKSGELGCVRKTVVALKKLP